jgi:hypothetical protein
MATKIWLVMKSDYDDRWQVRKKGADKAVRLFNTKAGAEEYAKTLEEKESRTDPSKKAGTSKKKTDDIPDALHLTKRDDGKWQLKAEGAERALRVFETMGEAEGYAKRNGYKIIYKSR